MPSEKRSVPRWLPRRRRAAGLRVEGVLALINFSRTNPHRQVPGPRRHPALHDPPAHKALARLHSHSGVVRQPALCPQRGNYMGYLLLRLGTPAMKSEPSSSHATPPMACVPRATAIPATAIPQAPSSRVLPQEPSPPLNMPRPRLRRRAGRHQARAPRQPRPRSAAGSASRRATYVPHLAYRGQPFAMPHHARHAAAGFAPRNHALRPLLARRAAGPHHATTRSLLCWPVAPPGPRITPPTRYALPPEASPALHRTTLVPADVSHRAAHAAH